MYYEISAAISIHTPREGSDNRQHSPLNRPKNFNPHSPRGERLLAQHPAKPSNLFQSTLPARGATELCGTITTQRGISIHTPREGSDVLYSSRSVVRVISIHTPREGSDFLPAVQLVDKRQFQSTLPARGATLKCCRGRQHYADFNPHSPRGERRLWKRASTPTGDFNPHSPRGERLFNQIRETMKTEISIHTPREGSDCPTSCCLSLHWDFNPHSPRGERPIWLARWTAR